VARCLITRELTGTAPDRLAGAGHEVEVRRERLPPSHLELLAAALRFDALLTMLTDPVDEEVFAVNPDLRAIANYAVGTDNIDLSAATARGIPVGNTPDVLTETTADLALALMLALMRRLREGEGEVRAGRWVTWEPARLLGRDLNGATVLVVGAGRIGRAVMRRLEGFRCRVVTAGRGDELAPLLGEADVVTLHCPLTRDTRGLIGARQLAAMKAGAYLVNTARGPIVDTEALVAALGEGSIAGAALDVTDPEPLPPDHPLTRVPGLLVVPHIASATHATREAMADMAVDNLLAALAGERMPHCANPEVYER
jgi:glyoxylate reductase